MAIKYLILLSAQGKVRLSKWYITIPQKEKLKIIRELVATVLARKTKMCNVLEHKDGKIVYRRYASLFFVCGIDADDNELITLEMIHRYVEQMDKSYEKVCELDIIFNFQKAYHILDEMFIDGTLLESSKREVLKRVGQADQLETTDEMEV
ncbi:unnamed protein product [Kuraishia capsulata CBS 1993]|uniref:AP complex subunit sigma n=1 Tax=Kuraishia capsulata CBS 1993 TaxID=1382522 RepID=W6MKF2_9ASCO|nr:uncharacterized protein KUCA_T00001124001 [Kuraishia capsulata CBS 1993]CDK25157.1 unnamed protein product [Kuraishia capsulata CBS 1993]